MRADDNFIDEFCQLLVIFSVGGLLLIAIAHSAGILL